MPATGLQHPYNSPSWRRTLSEFGTLAGFTFGALLVLLTETIVGPDAMAAWGWRLPFLIAAPLGLIGIYLRTKLEDTPCFRELEQAHETEEETTTEFRDLLVRYWRPLLQLARTTGIRPTRVPTAPAAPPNHRTPQPPPGPPARPGRPAAPR